MGAINLPLLPLLLLLPLLATVATAPVALSMPAMKLLESLGLPSFSMGSITQGERLRQEDSPIYYIKLPAPAPTSHLHNALDLGLPLHQEDDYYLSRPTTRSPFQQVPVEFTNNGRPDQIFHWSRPTTSDHFWNYKPFNQHNDDYNNNYNNNNYNNNGAPAPIKVTPKTTSTTTSTTTTTTTPKPTTTTTTTTTTPAPTTTPYKYPTATAWPPVPMKTSTKKPWVSFVKQFSSNGRPSGVYIYKARPVIKAHKYKHPLFRHFNY